MMFSYRDLRVPIVGAPMAGGPSTPELVAAVSGAGGIGFLAAGYLTPDRLATDIDAVRAQGVDLFGVNIFVPEFGRVFNPDNIHRYRQALEPYARELGVELPPDNVLAEHEDDYWTAKLDIVDATAVPVVSFTFGCPNADIVARLHDRGIAVTVTVTTVVDARTAVAAGVDSLCVQGPEAGGHRSTFRIDTEPPEVPLGAVLASITAVVDVPLVAAGGISTAGDVRRVVDIGAVAAQVGTALLRTTEAGTKPAHADALVDDQFTETVITRTFSGRPARALRNRFTDMFDASAPSEYPAVNTLVGAVKKPTDPHTLNLWAGVGHRHASNKSASAVVEQLTPGENRS